jgi:hypothetical protein
MFSLNAILWSESPEMILFVACILEVPGYIL